MRRSIEPGRPALRARRISAGQGRIAHGEPRRRSRRPLVSAGLVAFVLTVGYLTAHGRGLILMGLFVALPALVAALRAFDELVLAIPFVALLIRFSLPTGSDSRVSAAMLLVMLLAGIWIVTALYQRQIELTPSVLNAPLLSFIAVCLIALAWSIAFRDPLVTAYGQFTLVQLGACAAMVLSPIATLLIANFVRTTERLRWIALVFVGVGVVSTLGYEVGLKLGQLNTGGLFALWFIAVGYAIVISLPSLPSWMRLALSLVLLLHMYDRAVTSIAWVSGWLPALTAVLVITWLRSKRAAVGLLLALALLATLQWSFIQQEVFEEAERDGSYERLTLWDLNLELIREHPLVGTGPAGYAIYYMTYHPEEARSTHNNYLDIIAQTGIIGSLCWLWLMAAAGREAWLALRYAPPGWPRTLSLAAAGGLAGAVVAMTLGDWVLPFAYNQGIEGYRYTVFSWIFLGVLISVRQQVAPQAERQRERRVSLIQARRAQLAASAAQVEQSGIDRPKRGRKLWQSRRSI